jgi:hypothetical protein
MSVKIEQPRYFDKKDLIRNELRKCAEAQPLKVLTYAAFGERVGIPTRGPWKGILDLIALEEKKANRPDITFLVVTKRTGYPSQICFQQANPPSEKQKAKAKAELEKIIATYNPKATNPF